MQLLDNADPLSSVYCDMTTDGEFARQRRARRDGLLTARAALQAEAGPWCCGPRTCACAVRRWTRSAETTRSAQGPTISLKARHPSGYAGPFAGGTALLTCRDGRSAAPRLFATRQHCSPQPTKWPSRLRSRQAPWAGPLATWQPLRSDKSVSATLPSRPQLSGVPHRPHRVPHECQFLPAERQQLLRCHRSFGSPPVLRLRLQEHTGHLSERRLRPVRAPAPFSAAQCLRSAGACCSAHPSPGPEIGRLFLRSQNAKACFGTAYGVVNVPSSDAVYVHAAVGRQIVAQMLTPCLRVCLRRPCDILRSTPTQRNATFLYFVRPHVGSLSAFAALTHRKQGTPWSPADCVGARFRTSTLPVAQSAIWVRGTQRRSAQLRRGHCRPLRAPARPQ
jgi:hypothetical protein